MFHPPQRIPAIRSKKNFRGRFRREERQRVNERIRAPSVRLIDSDGGMAGIMPSFEALKRAREKGLDLVEISAQSDPPVCKIMDYGKWKFEAKKKQRQNRKSQTKVLLKEIQLRMRTDEGDIKIKLQKARNFLSQGHKVKIKLRFFGRELAHKELGFRLLQDVEKRLSDSAAVETPATMERRALFAILAPLGSQAKAGRRAQPKQAGGKPAGAGAAGAARVAGAAGAAAKIQAPAKALAPAAEAAGAAAETQAPAKALAPAAGAAGAAAETQAKAGAASSHLPPRAPAEKTETASDKSSPKDRSRQT